MEDLSIWSSVDYAVDLDTYKPIPCFNCNSSYNTDYETGLCRDKCEPLASLSTCNGGICPVLWIPEVDVDDVF